MSPKRGPISKEVNHLPTINFQGIFGWFSGEYVIGHECLVFDDGSVSRDYFQATEPFEQGSGRSSFCRMEWPEMIDFITKRYVRIILKNGIFST